ncbi:TPA: hypothetical protein JGU28_000661 [Salmonella enterica]|nr:hypothetical protein [Salmonella enterica]
MASDNLILAVHHGKARKMRIDNRLNRDSFTTRQLFFVECWSNLSHKESIDSDRVSYNNILNSLNELLQLYEFGEKYNAVDKRYRAAIELLEILKTDNCLSDIRFEKIPDQIILLCDRNELKDKTKSPIEQQPKLIQSLCSHLIELIHKHYIDILLEKISIAINIQESPDNNHFNEIYLYTNNLMSHLVTRGMPLTECYLLYYNILRHVENGDFSEKYDSWETKIKSPESTFIVTMFLENEKLFNLLSAHGSSLTFDSCDFLLPDEDGNKNKIEVSIKVSATSKSSARSQAEYVLRKSLDVIAYMVGKSDIVISKPYKVTSEDGSTREFRNFDTEINANSDRLTPDEFLHFMNAMGCLYKNATPESRKKISSAFKFLRNGITNLSQESKFTSYWSAIESLTLGVSSKDIAHDEHVILSVVPCMALDYIVKQLFSLRGIIRHLSITELNDGNNSYDLTNVNLGELFTALTNTNISTHLLASLADYPYAKFIVSKTIELCNSPEKTVEKSISHMSKVSLHIHRLYGVRNSIVHNAETNPRISLLTVNLEHYLRGTINALFYTVFICPSVSSPEEAFIRYQFMLENIMRELDPTYGITHGNTLKKIKEDLKDNKIIRKTDSLIAWLTLHK